MTDRSILSEKPEDNIAAMEWGIRQGELMRKGEEITRKLNKNYIPIILEMERRKRLTKPSKNWFGLKLSGRFDGMIFNNFVNEKLNHL